MNIGIDGYEANVETRVGIGEYSFQVLTQLYGLIHASTKHRVTVYLPSAPLSHLPAPTKQWTYRVIPVKRLWTFVGLPFGIYSTLGGLDVFYSPTHYIPRIRRCPQVMAIMDLSFLAYPELFRKQDLFKLTTWTEYGVLHSDAICTISNFSRTDIISTYAVQPERVYVTYPGLKTMPNDPSTIIAGRPLPKKYILSVGTIQPRKNYERLVEAFAQAKNAEPALFESVKLLIVGKRGWLYEASLAAPAKYHVEDEVHFIHDIDDTALRTIYEHSIGLACVSLYEGFGLPVLEAMAAGKSVVVSNVSSLPEIAGESGIYVEPNTIESIANGLETLVREHNTKKEANRREKSLQHIKQFSWETAARKTLAILEEIGAKKN